MLRWVHRLGLGLVVGAGITAGCAASNDTGAGGAATTTSAAGQGGASSTSSLTTSTQSGGGDLTSTTTGGGSTSSGECAKFTAEASQAPAAMLIALDASASMTGQSKWGTAQLAIAGAIDKDVFDTMSLGLMTFPNATVCPPACLGLPCALLKVGCGISVLAQVPMTPAGTDKTFAPTGVRKDIYQYLVSHNPIDDGVDGSPIYDALAAGYNVLKAYPIERRTMVLITDGGFSCTSVANPSRAGYFDGACYDWEIPDTVNTLIKGAHDDAAAPINTFIVGVPGSDSTGANQNGYATAPYHMKLALSTYAVSGSPETIDPACDANLAYTQNGADPAVPCHIDLSSGAAFNSDSLTSALATLRGKALGCVYDLPAPPPGETIDPSFVNVDVTLDGALSALPKRSDPNDDCAASGCWDYNASNQVQILGKTCTDIGVATAAKVDIRVGCATILK